MRKNKAFREGFDWNTRFNLQTQVGKYKVSTVDLGIDHNFLGKKPLYYETMIFSDDGENVFKEYQERYETEKEARDGHEATVNYVRDYCKNNEIDPDEVLDLLDKCIDLSQRMDEVVRDLEKCIESTEEQVGSLQEDDEMFSLILNGYGKSLEKFLKKLKDIE